MKFKLKVVALALLFSSITTNISNAVVLQEGDNNIYEKEKAVKHELFKRFSLENNDYIKPEYEEKIEILNNSYDLKAQTEYSFEVAKAYEDGTYTFVEGCNSYKEAVEKADAIGICEENGQTVAGVVLTDGGKVTYSPYGVGRIRQYNNSSLDVTYGIVSLIYGNENNVGDTNKANTYINHGFIDDVALITSNENAAKIEFSSTTGWISKANKSGNYDLVVVPINQYKNPSYYINDNGILYHFISNDIQSTVESGNLISLGKSPEYLEQGKKYLSFDGNYFYEASSIKTAYMNIVNDLKELTHNNSVNCTNPYYSYYNYLPFRSKTSYTAAQLDAFIEKNTDSDSKLRGIGQYLIKAENEYGVNALLTLGVAINESGWGKSNLAMTKNNLFGLNAQDSNLGNADSFKSVEACIYNFTKNYISLGYSDCNDSRGQGAFLGNKGVGVNVKYASDPFWGEKASSLAFKVDYNISNKDLNNLGDLNNYAIVMFTGESSILDAKGNLLYRITDAKTSRTIPKGTTLALSKKGILSKFDKQVYEVNPDRDISYEYINEYTGDYDFSFKGYVDISNTRVINLPKKYSTNYILQDINGDGIVDISDLSKMASYYNSYDYYIDLNEDKIVDIYDIISVAKMIN